METFKIYLPLRPLLALREIAAKKDVRYYLNGVALEIGPAGAFMVASDGSAMGVARLAEWPAGVQVKLVIPNSMLAHLRPSKACYSIALTAQKNEDTDPPRWRLELDTLAGCVSDWAEPCPIDWQRVVPRQVSGETAQFNPGLLAKFCRAGAMLGQKRTVVTIGHNGTGPALIGLGDLDFFGVLMPMLAEAMDAPPAWVTGSPIAAAA